MNNRNQLQASIEKLRNTKYITFASIDEPILNDPRLMEYFEAPFDSDIDREFEKIVATATIRSTYSSKFIPKSLKYDVAQRLARQVVEALRYAKLDYKFETEKISAKEYQKRITENKVAQKSSIVKKVAKSLAYAGTKMAVSAVIGAVTTALGVAAAPAAIVTGITFATTAAITTLVPKEVKTKVKQSLRETTQQCVSMANTAIKGMVATGQKVCKKIAEKVAPVVEKAASTLVRVGEKVKEGLQSVKQGAKKLWNKIFG